MNYNIGDKVKVISRGTTGTIIGYDPQNIDNYLIKLNSNEGHYARADTMVDNKWMPVPPSTTPDRWYADNSDLELITTEPKKEYLCKPNLSKFKYRIGQEVIREGKEETVKAIIIGYDIRYNTPAYLIQIIDKYSNKGHDGTHLSNIVDAKGYKLQLIEGKKDRLWSIEAILSPVFSTPLEKKLTHKPSITNLKIKSNGKGKIIH